MAIPSVYNTGTASINAGDTAVTGQGTSWLTTGIAPGDLFWAAGLDVRVASVNSNTSLTLAAAWPGSNRAAAAYEIRREPDEVRVLEASRQLLTMLTNGNLSSIAALVSAANKLPYYSGAGVAALADLTAHARAILALSGGAGKFFRSTGASTAVLQDIVGAVSQSSGVPTGALIETGSNANGVYSKFADGTMICAGKGTMAYLSTSALAASYSFPAAFIAAPPGVSCTSIWSEVGGALTQAGYQSYGDVVPLSVSTTTLNLRLGRLSGSNFASGDTLGVSIIAVGRWFA